jgi:hypothetical protein
LSLDFRSAPYLDLCCERRLAAGRGCYTNTAVKLFLVWDGLALKLSTWGCKMSKPLGARDVRYLAVLLLLATAMAGIAPAAPAAAARTTSPAPAASFTVSGLLTGVAATSARSAWAVGNTGSGKTLIVRWNGSAWKQVRGPSPAGGARLTGVAASSATSAWAVGYTDAASSKTLILRWNGRAWNRVPSPSPAGSALLSGVAVTRGL